ncbi:MAG: GNAT family N-acetyltransferase [Cytophagales bacterium]|nr:GNAT family N-acetyltransferase [Cytophagales bacterium]
MEFRKYFGGEIKEVLNELGNLRIHVFLDFPYLYEGSLEYEKEYLQTYIDSQESMLFSVWDGNKMVGATTCIPLKDETIEIKEPFEKAGISIEEIFYFGESILLKPFRGKGLGHRFFQERENHVATFDHYKSMYFCGVERAKNHPLKPEDYQPLDKFWNTRGFAPTALVSYFEWKDIDEETPSKKKMNYWKKDLPQ